MLIRSLGRLFTSSNGYAVIQSCLDEYLLSELMLAIILLVQARRRIALVSRPEYRGALASTSGYGARAMNRSTANLASNAVDV